MKVCRYDEGNTPVFSCPLSRLELRHRRQRWWACPYFKDAYKARTGQVAVGPDPKCRRCTTTRAASGRRGTSQRAFDFLEYIGDFTHVSRPADGRAGRQRGRLGNPGGRPEVDDAQQLEVRRPRTSLGDGYHNISHRSVDMVGIGPSRVRAAATTREYKAGATSINVSMPRQRGHAAP